MSKVRLWTLGKLGDSWQTTVIPTAKTIQKLKDILAGNIDGGTIDLVWGPDLECRVIDEAVSDNILIPVRQNDDGETLYRILPVQKEQSLEEMEKEGLIAWEENHRDD